MTAHNPRPGEAVQDPRGHFFVRSLFPDNSHSTEKADTAERGYSPPPRAWP